MGSVALSLFIAVVLIHLYARWGEKDSAAAITKPFLMPLLYFAAISLSNVDRSYLLAIAALFYTLGDIFLIFKVKKPLFVAGIFSFMAGHLFYIAFFTLRSFSIEGLAAGAVVFAIPFAVYIHKIRKSGTEDFWGYMLYGAMIYIFAAGTASSCSLSHPRQSLFAIIGIVLFAFSDSRIAYNRARVEATTDFVIMLTYIAANIALVSAAVLPL